MLPCKRTSVSARFLRDGFEVSIYGQAGRVHSVRVLDQVLRMFWPYKKHLATGTGAHRQKLQLMKIVYQSSSLTPRHAWRGKYFATWDFDWSSKSQRLRECFGRPAILWIMVFCPTIISLRESRKDTHSKHNLTGLSLVQLWHLMACLQVYDTRSMVRYNTNRSRI